MEVHGSGIRLKLTNNQDRERQGQRKTLYTVPEAAMKLEFRMMTTLSRQRDMYKDRSFHIFRQVYKHNILLPYARLP